MTKEQMSNNGFFCNSSDIFYSKKSELFHQEYIDHSGYSTEEEITPENSFKNRKKIYQKCPEEGIDILIDVKPKRKEFKTEAEKIRYIQGFTQKKKTELCKNWEHTGYCKYQNKCSFAHGLEELKSKTHLSENFKLKPCKRYLLDGVCYYGKRCQYLHREIKYSPEHQEFLQKNLKSHYETLRYLVNYKCEMKILEELGRDYLKKQDVQKVLFKEKEGKRLGVFRNLKGN